MPLKLASQIQTIKLYPGYFAQETGHFKHI